MIFFTVEYHFFGSNPFGYHLVSVLFHCLNSLAVFALIYSFTARMGVSTFGALLFGLHPLQVEPVVWIAAGHYPIGAFFFLSTVILYRSGFKGLSFIAFFLALLFYSLMALPLPLILLAIDHYAKGKVRWKDVYDKTPFFILTFYFGWLTLKAAHHTEADYVPFFLAHHLSFLARLNLSSEALWMYGQKFFIPDPVSCYYPVIYYFHKGLFLYSLMGAAMLLLFTRFRRQKSFPVIFLGLSWFLLTITPFLHIYGVGESIIYNRYLYIPCIGILLMLIGIWEVLRFEKIAKAAVLLWFIFILVLSGRQIVLWRDSESLWTHFISLYPQFPDGYLNRSEYYLTVRKPLLALRDTDMLLRFSPSNAAAYQNRGHAFLQLGQWRQEIKAYDKVVELNPDLTAIYVDRGAAHFMLGEDKLALEDFNQALQKDPREEAALFNRGLVYFYHRDYRRSLKDLQRVVLLDSGNDRAKSKIDEIKKIPDGD